jgi:hypothetical protein
LRLKVTQHKYWLPDLSQTGPLNTSAGQVRYVLSLG